MARLIDADEAYKVLTDYYHHKTEIQHKAFKEAIDRVPTVDPVKHGHWVEQERCDWVYSKECRCSECGKYRLMTNPFGREWNYCPNCGAKMDEVEKE